MPKQQAGVTNILDFRSGLRPDIPELELGNSSGQQRVTLFSCFDPRFISRLIPPLAQHRGGHPFPSAADYQIARNVPRVTFGDLVNQPPETIYHSIRIDLDPQPLAGLVLLDEQKATFNVIHSHDQHVGRPLTSKVGQVHRILELWRRFLLDSGPHSIVGVIVPWRFLVFTHALTRVLPSSEALLARHVEYMRQGGDLPVGPDLG